MFDIGGTEGLVIVLAILLLFGARRIPDIAKSLGSGIREFRRAMREISEEVQSATSLTGEPPRTIRPNTPGPPPALPQPEASVAVPGPETAQAPAPEAAAGTTDAGTADDGAAGPAAPVPHDPARAPTGA